jgi:hypothetical protein
MRHGVGVGVCERKEQSYSLAKGDLGPWMEHRDLFLGVNRDSGGSRDSILAPLIFIPR